MRNSTIIAIITGAILLACNTGGPENNSHQPEEQDTHGHDHHPAEETVELTEKQVANAAIQIDSLRWIRLSGSVQANGHLDLPPDNVASINAPMTGFVKKANYLVGDYVKEGQVMAVLTHPDYIKLQEEYLDVSSKLEYLEKELERQQTLAEAKVSAQKKLQKTKSNYQSAKARKQSLKKQLHYLGIRTGELTPETLTSTIRVQAPFPGYITSLNIHKGKYVEPEQEMYEMVNIHHMHLELNVFEKDIYKVEKGQAITFRVPSVSKERYEGVVHLVGKSFNKDNKTVRIHGHLKDRHPKFIRGLYVEAVIHVGDKPVQAVPQEAVVQDENQSYIFIATDHRQTFRRIPVRTGMSSESYIEIKPQKSLPGQVEVVTKGAYYLISAMDEGGGHHHH